MYYMNDEIISLRIGSDVREKMRQHAHINWSAILRKALIEEVNKLHTINKERALKALKNALDIRKSGVFNSKITGAEIIREWREKRR